MTERKRTKAVHPATRAYVEGVASMLGSMEHYFEERLCRCTPLRHRLRVCYTEAKRIEAEYDAQAQTATATLRTEIAALEAQVRLLDREDHPEADRKARDASRLAERWVWEKVLAGVVLPADREAIRALFFEEFEAGWRPTPIEGLEK